MDVGFEDILQRRQTQKLLPGSQPFGGSCWSLHQIHPSGVPLYSCQISSSVCKNAGLTSASEQVQHRLLISYLSSNRIVSIFIFYNVICWQLLMPHLIVFQSAYVAVYTYSRSLVFNKILRRRKINLGKHPTTLKRNVQLNERFLARTTAWCTFYLSSYIWTQLSNQTHPNTL